MTLLGLAFAAIVIGFLGYVAVRTFPTVLEYMAVQRTVDKIAAAPPGTVPEIRNAFDRQRDVDGIQTISGKDLDIGKVNDRVVIRFSYEREVPLGGPAYLLLKYQGRSK